MPVTRDPLDDQCQVLACPWQFKNPKSTRTSLLQVTLNHQYQSRGHDRNFRKPTHTSLSIAPELGIQSAAITSLVRKDKYAIAGVQLCSRALTYQSHARCGIHSQKRKQSSELLKGNKKARSANIKEMSKAEREWQGEYEQQSAHL